MVTSKDFAEYIIERISHDLGFLKSQGLLSAGDESAILARLSNIQYGTPNNIASVASSPVGLSASPASQSLTRSAGGPLIPTPSPITVPQSPTFPLKQVRTPSGGSTITSTPTITATDPALLKRAVPPPPPRNIKVAARCQALWDYNLDGAEENDLSFRKGDIIELIDDERANNDWWFGTIGDQTGLFPSNHVEKIPTEQPNRFRGNESAIPHNSPAPAYSASGYGATPNLYEKGRFPGQAQSSLSPSPTQAHSTTFASTSSDGEGLNQHGLHQTQDPEKKDKYKRLKGQVGTAVTTGFGFGAGAAVGSGIVNAIF
ncbi:hypothetical protein FRC02_001788 [Tulasnella sp. 418]|nr:hypothetical protein FRC02_001788 [Tulasnella sp. 418]